MQQMSVPLRSMPTGDKYRYIYLQQSWNYQGQQEFKISLFSVVRAELRFTAI